MSGIFGAYSLSGESIADELLIGTVSLQHRGEEGCGISCDTDGKFYTDKARQLAYYFFRDRTNGLEGLRRISSSVAIGHTLYEDSGGLQPVEEPGENHVISLAMDGVLLGYGGKNDSVMRAMFSRALDDFGEDIYSAVGNVMERFKGRGSYCVASLVRNDNGISLVAFRDPKGIKPYGLAKKNGKYFVMSESKTADAIESEFVRDIEPGEVIVVSRKGFDSKILFKERHAHCFFEWIYFADPTSVIEGRNVYEFRKELGRKIAQRYSERLKGIDLVMASPDSGRGVAIGVQQELSRLFGRFIPYEEAAVKNPGAKRTFQVEDPEERELAARVKFFINSNVVRGKKIVVGDDSIVRGTVFRDGMIYKLKKAGAKEIYPLISCPALLHACIKDPKGKDFAAYGLNGSVVEVGARVAEKLGVDFVCYPTEKEMVDALGLEDICAACVNGDFPVDERFCK